MTAQERPAPAHGLPFHRLAHLRPAWAAWWRPLLTVFAALVAFTVLASLLLVATVLALSLLPGAHARELGRRLGDPSSPLDVFMILAMGAILVPSALVGVRIGGWRPVGTVLSVTGGLRRELLVRGLPVLVPFLLVAGGLAVVDPMPRPPADAGRTAAVMVLVVLLAPLHAAGAELAFRGIAQQALGTWLRHPAVPILLPVPLGLLGRGLPDAGAVVTALATGAACGALAWKAGGLELPILVHLGVTGSAMLLGPCGAPSIPGAGSVPAAALTLATLLLVTAVLVVQVSRRERIGLLQPVRRPVGLPAPDPVRF